MVLSTRRLMCIQIDSFQILKGVVFFIDGKSYIYNGENSDLRLLKIHLGPFLIQKRVQDEYKPQNILGKGSFAMVEFYLYFQVLEIRNLYSNKIYAGKCIDKAKLRSDDRDLVINIF